MNNTETPTIEIGTTVRVVSGEWVTILAGMELVVRRLNAGRAFLFARGSHPDGRYDTLVHADIKDLAAVR